jgi:sugar lactone lactonase YvrE
MNRASRLALAGALTVTAATAAARPPAAAGTLPFAVAHRIEVAGGAPITALVFASDGKQAYSAVGDELRSVDVATGSPGARVTVPGQVVALAAATDAGGTLYAAVAAPARLLVLGTHPLRIRSSVALRSGTPSGLLYEPGEHALYVESQAGRSVARLDSGDGKTRAVARLRGGLAQMAGDGRGTLYIANPLGDAIDVVATDKMLSTGAIPTPNCHAPTGLDFDPVGRRLFVACGSGTALVIDTDMGFAFEQLPIDKGTAQRMVFTFHAGGPGGWKGGAFIAGDAPALDGIRMNAFISYIRDGSMPLRGQATALAVSPDGSQLWIGLAPRDGEPGPVEILALGASGGAQ